MMKNEKGITLTSLVIMIIVLIIIASIATYSGIGTIRYVKFNKARAEMQSLSAQVNKWKDEYKNGNASVLNYGESLNDISQEAKDAVSTTFSSARITDETIKGGYRFFSENYLKDTLGLDSSYDYIININNRDVLLVGGLMYNNKKYYTLEDFGIINVEEHNAENLSFTLSKGNNTEIVISNVKMNFSEQNVNPTDISKFIVEYKKVDEDTWKDVTKDITRFEDGEGNNKTTKFKFVVNEYDEYEVKISTIDKKYYRINEFGLYDIELTEEATGIYVSTLNYTATSETDDSKLLTIDGAMLLSAGSQAVPSRVQNEKFVWKSSDKSVATVTSDGVVKCGTEAGTAIITLIGSNNTKCICKVKTTSKIAKSKSNSNYTINGEEGSDLNPTIPGGFYPIDTNITEDTTKNIEWDLTGNQTKTGKGLAIMNDAGDQFVWVPVKKDEAVYDPNVNTAPSTTAVTVTSNLYTPMATTYDYNGETYYRGMLYTFGGDTTSTTVKYESGYNVGSNNNKEPSLLTSNTNDKWAPLINVIGTRYDAQYYINAGYTAAQGVIGFGAQMQSDYDKMIRQVQTYGGFWVGRFESSWNDKILKIASIAGAKSFTSADTNDRNEVNMWYGLYRTHKAYSNNSSVIWGSQYDTMMSWMAKNGITVGTSTEMSGTTRNIGNNATDGQRITGNPNYNDKLNNVIDLYGNSCEWTLECKDSNSRTQRGGKFDYYLSPTERTGGFPDGTGGKTASRITLYIK